MPSRCCPCTGRICGSTRSTRSGRSTTCSRSSVAGSTDTSLQRFVIQRHVVTTSGPGSPSPQTPPPPPPPPWLLIAVFVVIGWMTLSFLAKVLSPILAALGIAYLLNPVLERLVKQGLPRAVGAGLILISFVALIVTAIATAIPAIVHQVGDFAHDLPRLITNLDTWLHDHFGVALPEDWRHYLTKANLEQTFGGEGPLRDLATAALGGVF